MSRHLRVLVACLVSGCAGQSFQPTFKPPERPTPEKVLAQIVESPPRQDERAVMVGVAAEPERLVAWDGSGRLLWEHEVDVRSAPVVAGDRVITHEGERLVVRDLERGRAQVTLEEPARLVGADGVAGRLVLSLAYTEPRDHGPRGLLVFVDGDRVRWTHELKLGVGTPALSESYAIVPWATHRVSVLDLRDGQEVARWYFTATVLGHARVDRGNVYLGQHGFLRLSEGLFEQQVKDVQPVAPSKRELPGQPTLLRDGYAPVPEPDNAHHRVRAEWRLGAGEQPIENDTLYARFYRTLFAMEGGRDELRWVHTFEHDLIGAEVRPDGLVVADTAGQVHILSPDGQRRTLMALGRSLRVMTLRMGEPWRPAAEEQEAAPPLPALSAQLYAAASLDDDRLSAARTYAVNRLARDSSPRVTEQLVGLCADRAAPEPVGLAACARLGERDSGQRAVLDALAPRAPGQPPVRIGALALAAGHMRLSGAVPELLKHLQDLRTDTGDLALLIEALSLLHDRRAVPVIERFLRLHHAEPDGSELQPAVQAAARALGELRAKSSRPTLERIAGDGLGPELSRKAAEGALAMLDAPPPSAEPARSAKPAPEVAEAEPEAPPLPRLLSAEMIAAAFEPVHAELVRCMRAQPEPPPSGRIALVVGGSDGAETNAVESVYVTPSVLRACMEPLVRTLKFPPTQRGREQITHVVRLAEPAQAAAGKARGEARQARRRGLAAAADKRTRRRATDSASPLAAAKSPGQSAAVPDGQP